LLWSVIFGKEYWVTLWRCKNRFFLFLFLINFSLALPPYRNEFLLRDGVNAFSSLRDTAGESLLLDVKLLELLLDCLPLCLIELSNVGLDIFFLEVLVDLRQQRCYQFLLCFHGI